MSATHYFPNIPTFEGTQVEWELHHYRKSVEEYLFDAGEKRKAGKASETSAGDKIIRMHVEDVSDVLKKLLDIKGKGRGKEFRTALTEAAMRPVRGKMVPNYDLVAYLGLLITLQYVYAEKEKLGLLTNIITGIGYRLEQDMKFSLFKMENPDLAYSIENSFKQQNLTSHRHKIITFQKKWNERELEWEPWNQHKRAQLGLRVFKAIMMVMPDYFNMTKKYTGKHYSHYIEPTALLNQIVKVTDDSVAKRCALTPPCIEAPLDWDVDMSSGGYHSIELRQQNSMIKESFGHKKQKEMLRADPPIEYIKAINNLQRTQWEINPFTTEFLETVLKTGMLPKHMPPLDHIEMPPYPDEGTPEDIIHWKREAKVVHRENKQRVNKIINVQKALSLAKQLRDRPLWFVYSADFRGRLYCTAGAITPQSEDYARSLLRFREGKPLGKDGLKWLAIHGANKYGIDKVSYDDRVRWIMGNEDAIRTVATDPSCSEARSFIGEADKPFQFAAFCNEWSTAQSLADPTSFSSHLPIGLDGSCNGLQHYAALLRDEVGGASVNLLPSERPKDIYNDVAEELKRLLTDDHDGKYSKRFLDAGVTRQLTKRPVMVLPYGATRRSCMQYIGEYINEHPEKYDVIPKSPEVWKLVSYLGPLMWQAIENVVLSAREGMAWLQAVSGNAAKAGHHLSWTNPMGFPVCQQYNYYKDRVITTSIFGSKKISVSNETDGINYRKSKLAIAPNYIHSIDSCHAVMTINEGHRKGINSFSFIHDDFGTHAADTEQLFVTTREAFVQLHSRPLLEEWKEQIEEIGCEIPPYPKYGSLDINQVKESDYFFG